MTDISSELHSYDVRDPAQLIHDIAAQVELIAGTAHLALVRDVSTDQRVLRVDRLRLPAEIIDGQEAEDELHRTITSWPLPPPPPRRRPRHTPVLVVVRPGLCVFGPNEVLWLTAERYANHGADVWSMQLIVVTEHGWLDFMTNHAGSEPFMEPC